MRIIALVLSSLTLTGCEGRVDHLAECEEALKDSLQSTASFSLVSATGDYRPSGARYVMAFNDLSEAGEAVSGTAVCAFDGGAAIITTNTVH
jgi:predicted small secreted protein